MSKPHEKHAFQLEYLLIGGGALVAGGAWAVGPTVPCHQMKLVAQTCPPDSLGLGSTAPDHDRLYHLDFHGHTHTGPACHVRLPAGIVEARKGAQTVDAWEMQLEEPMEPETAGVESALGGAVQSI